MSDPNFSVISPQAGYGTSGLSLHSEEATLRDMSIQAISKADFGARINAVLSPARPIRSIEHLKGRTRELDIIERALYADGRHVFVYGDRGVGKSSLAATAAFQYQSADANPIFVAGAQDDSFRSVVANIANKALGRSRTESIKQTTSVSLEWRGLKWSSGQEVNPIDIASRIQSVGDAAELLHEIAQRHSEKPIVVIDEFDTIANLQERNKFAHLLKHLGDQSTNIKVIFTGVGSSLDDLLGAHQSAHRQLEQVELPRLGWEARREIVENAADAFALSVNNDVNWRIAIVSDGFPYYVHLITERMLWEAFTDDYEVTELAWPHYHLGLRAAIEGINAQLKRPYEKAVTHRSETYEDVVWSTADGEDLYRPLPQMFEAYLMVARKRGREEKLPRSKYSEHVRRLKDTAFGSILLPVSNRPGWYTYNERMLRGYVRMQAEANGVELSGEREAPRPKMYIPANVRTGTHGPSVPRGVRVNKPISSDDQEG